MSYNKFKPIYERDVLKFSVNNQEQIGEVCYSRDIAAFVVDVYPIMKLDIDKFEIIGNIEQNYYYNESGDLTKKKIKRRLLSKKYKCTKTFCIELIPLL